MLRIYVFDLCPAACLFLLEPWLWFIAAKHHCCWTTVLKLEHSCWNWLQKRSSTRAKQHSSFGVAHSCITLPINAQWGIQWCLHSQSTLNMVTVSQFFSTNFQSEVLSCTLKRDTFASISLEDSQTYSAKREASKWMLNKTNRDKIKDIWWRVQCKFTSLTVNLQLSRNK